MTPKGNQGQLKESGRCKEEHRGGSRQPKRGKGEGRKEEADYLGSGVMNWSGDQEGLALRGSGGDSSPTEAKKCQISLGRED